jgi:hypothetical protein
MPRYQRLVPALLAATIALGAVPVHPQALEEPLQKYVAARVAEFDTIPAERRQVLRRLSRFIDDRLRENQPARLTFICTHNSRRSQLAQVWAATAAAYYGVPHVETFSGGTQTTEFNSRAIAALRRAGVVINQPQMTQNPHYDVRYRSNGPSLECFSKLYFSGPNPHSEFCAVMTCAQADKQCPAVIGASLRISLPYDDPKAFDNTPQEAAGYDERCRQIARELLFVFSNVQP